MRMCMSFLFFFNDTATTEIYTLSLHDALPIYPMRPMPIQPILCLFSCIAPSLASRSGARRAAGLGQASSPAQSRCSSTRSEEHTSELQSRQYLVCRLLLEKKKTYYYIPL